MHLPWLRPAIALGIVTLCSACGGGDAQKPAASPADTSSLEHEHESGGPSGGSAPSGGGSASSGSGGSDDSSSSKSSASSSSKSSGGGAGGGDSGSAAAAAPASVHPTPAATGAIDGKPFSPKIGRAMAAMQKDGRLLVTLTEGTDCAASPKGGDGLSFLLEWKDGYKTDVGSLKRATKPGGGEVGFSRGGSVSKSFKPTGRVTVVSAPTDANATGKIKLDVQSGDFMLAGDLDVLLCVAAK
jgi:hypothetical protein